MGTDRPHHEELTSSITPGFDLETPETLKEEGRHKNSWRLDTTQVYLKAGNQLD